MQETKNAIEVRATRHESIRVPPGPHPLPFVGNRYELYPDILGNYDRLFSLYGPMVKTINMGTTIYHTNDPGIARHVLREDQLFTKATSNPSHPLHYMADQEALFVCDSASPAFAPGRKFVPPTMSPRAIAHFMPLIHDATQSIFPIFDQMADSNLAINAYQYMLKLSSQIIWRVLLNQDLKHFESANTPPSLPIRLFAQYLSLMKKSSLQPQWFKYLPYSGPSRLLAVRQQLFGIFQDAMDTCIDKNGPPLPLSDPLALQSANCVADFLYRARDDKGEKLPFNLVIGNIVATTGAGFTTSASMLSWALCALVRHPDCQKRLHTELLNYHCNNPSPQTDTSKHWTYDKIHSLPFLDAFVKETLRLYNPSFQTARNAKVDTVLPGGYLIPKGSIVIACFPSIFKNPKHWENPLRFEPDRWMKEEDFAARMARQGSYTPFAAGMRGCVGFTLALTEAKLVLAELVWRYEFEEEKDDGAGGRFGVVVNDPEFMITRPLNLYVGINRRKDEGVEPGVSNKS